MAENFAKSTKIEPWTTKAVTLDTNNNKIKSTPGTLGYLSVNKGASGVTAALYDGSTLIGTFSCANPMQFVFNRKCNTDINITLVGTLTGLDMTIGYR